MKTLILTREKMTSKSPILGELEGSNGFCVKTGELPWKSNKPFKSCIPLGMYKCVYNKDKRVYDILNVPGRTLIQIHVGNTIKDTEGCILVGEQHSKDMLVKKSNKAFETLRFHAGDEFRLIITTTMHTIKNNSENIVNFRGQWSEVIQKIPVSDIKPIVYKKDKRPLWKKIFLSKRFFGIVISLTAIIIKKDNPELGNDILQIAAILESVGLIHAAYKSKPDHGGKAGWFYRFIDTLFTWLGKKGK